MASTFSGEHTEQTVALLLSSLQAFHSQCSREFAPPSEGVLLRQVQQLVTLLAEGQDTARRLGSNRDILRDVSGLITILLGTPQQHLNPSNALQDVSLSDTSSTDDGMPLLLTEPESEQGVVRPMSPDGHANPPLERLPTAEVPLPEALARWNGEWRWRCPQLYDDFRAGMPMPVRYAMVLEAYLDMWSAAQVANCKRSFCQALRRPLRRRRFSIGAAGDPAPLPPLTPAGGREGGRKRPHE